MSGEGGGMQKQYSRLGIASGLLCMLVFLLANLVVIIYLRLLNHPEFVTLRTALCYSTLILPGIALALGIAGLFEKNRRRLFAFIGIGISILYIILEILGYFVLQSLSRIEL